MTNASLVTDGGEDRTAADSGSEQENDIMTVLANWLPPLLVGVTFTLMGSLKLYGLIRGITGGHDKPLVAQLCGT